MYVRTCLLLAPKKRLRCRWVAWRQSFSWCPRSQHGHLKSRAGEREPQAKAKQDYARNLGGAHMHAWHSANSNVHLLMGAPPRLRPNIPVSFEDICMASHRIRNAVVHTACAYNPELSEITGTELYFKHEVGTGTLLMMLRVAACATWSLSTHKHTHIHTHTYTQAAGC
jgi:hypothetical protein